MTQSLIKITTPNKCGNFKISKFHKMILKNQILNIVITHIQQNNTKQIQISLIAAKSITIF
jgi:predicted XRE-type DNA-binding protein